MGGASATAFAVLFAAMYAAHEVGDHWVQTDSQAREKGIPGWQGRLACARHVAALTVTKAAAVALAAAVTGLHLSLLAVAAGPGRRFALLG
jgi:uncharacterized MAPEG superfamily protein